MMHAHLLDRPGYPTEGARSAAQGHALDHVLLRYRQHRDFAVVVATAAVGRIRDWFQIASAGLLGHVTAAAGLPLAGRAVLFHHLLHVALVTEQQPRVGLEVLAQ